MRESNSVVLTENEGLAYLRAFFDALFVRLGVDFRAYAVLIEHYEAFFASSQARIDRLASDGVAYVSDIAIFKKVFQPRTGIVVSTIHGIKGTEFDAVIAYALLEDFVPHFSDPNGQDSAKKLLYVIASRARKNLHLISERGRTKQTTRQLDSCAFDYDEVPAHTSAW